MAERRESLFFRGLARGDGRDAPVVAYADVQRARMLDAVVAAVADKGYAAATVGDVVGRAGVSRRTFYERFPDKEACFLTAYEDGARTVMQEIAAAVRDAAPQTWLERVRTGLEAYTGAMAAEPDFARTLLVEVLAAGPRALTRRREVLAGFVAYYRALVQGSRAEDPRLAAVPETRLRALVHAIDGLVQDHIVERGAGSVREITPDLVEIAVALLAAPRDVAAPDPA